MLSQSLEICYKYSILKNQPILSNTASATFRQMILHAFEKLDKGGEKFEIDALGLFQDLSGYERVIFKAACVHH